MVCQQNTYAFALQFNYYILYVSHCYRVYPCKWLVQQYEGRRVYQRPCYLHPSPFTTRKGICLAVLEMCYAKLVEKTFLPLILFVLRQVKELKHRPYILPHSKLSKDRCLLRKITYPLPGPLIHRELCNILVSKGYPPIFRPDKTYHHIKYRCLSCAVWP